MIFYEFNWVSYITNIYYMETKFTEDNNKIWDKEQMAGLKRKEKNKQKLLTSLSQAGFTKCPLIIFIALFIGRFCTNINSNICLCFYNKFKWELSRSFSGLQFIIQRFSWCTENCKELGHGYRESGQYVKR